jgi:hypothetical protein
MRHWITRSNTETCALKNLCRSEVTALIDDHFRWQGTRVMSLLHKPFSPILSAAQPVPDEPDVARERLMSLLQD